MKRLLPFILLFLIVGTACTDRKKSFLIGKWEDIPRVAVQKQRYIWNFKDDNNLVIEKFLIDTLTGERTLSSTATGEYSLERDNFENRLTIDMSEDKIDLYPISGKYWVHELDRSVLKITRDGYLNDSIEDNPFVRRELLKL